MPATEEIVGTPRRVDRTPAAGGGLMTREQGERLLSEVAGLRADLTKGWPFRLSIAWGVVLSVPVAVILGTLVLFVVRGVLDFLQFVAG